MNKLPPYPLQDVLEVKERRVEQAEKVVQEKKRLLKIEEDKLKAAKEERDKVKEHKVAKLLQMREELDQDTTSTKVQQMKRYLEEVNKKLKAEEKKVEDQQKKVTEAEKKVTEAKEELRKKRQDVDKIKLHHKEWESEMKKELLVKEEKIMDELGTTIHGIKKRGQHE